MNKDPEVVSRRGRSISRLWTDPEYRQRASEGMRAAVLRSFQADPAKREARAALMRRNRVDAPAGSEQRARAARTLSGRMLAWCPLEYRDEYRALRTSFGITAAAARSLIEDQIAADGRRAARTGTLPATARAAERTLARQRRD